MGSNAPPRIPGVELNLRAVASYPIPLMQEVLDRIDNGEADGEAADADPERLFVPGGKAIIHGLNASPSLNGRLALLKRFSESMARWQVALPGSVKDYNVRPRNLRPLTGDEEAQLEVSRRLAADDGSSIMTSALYVLVDPKTKEVRAFGRSAPVPVPSFARPLDPHLDDLDDEEPAAIETWHTLVPPSQLASDNAHIHAMNHPRVGVYIPCGDFGASAPPRQSVPVRVQREGTPVKLHAQRRRVKDAAQLSGVIAQEFGTAR
jgi:hypothetical protein